jgi:cell division protease FtsH
MDKKTQLHVWYFLIALFAILVFQNIWTQTQTVAQLPYSDFQTLLETGKIEDLVVTETHIRGRLREPLPNGRQDFITTRVDPGLAADLGGHGTTFRGQIESTFVRDILSWILPVLFFVGIWFFVFRKIAERQGLGGFMSVGKSRAKVYMEKETGVTFDDVAGVDEAKEELHEIVAFLKKPEEYGRLGARVPKGVLLVGPPGTGKTLLARAVAGEAGVTFFSINGSEFVEMFVGVGAARVRDLFEQARKNVPCIIFIDELDALGRARGLAPWGGGHDEKEQTLNQLLAELDGFDPSVGIVLLAATNRPEILDPALLRAGRFDRQVLVDRPDKVGRVAILKVHIGRIRLAPDFDIEQVAALTPGFTGADLANLVNEAATLATRRRAAEVTLDDFTAAIERIVAGLEKKNRLLNPHERRVVAHHEMGHALVALALPGSDVVHKVSIIPRGIGSLGYTIQRPTEDRYLMTKAELENKMTVLLAGRAAEDLVFTEVSTGAADDLAKATDIARSIVMRYGMTEALGHVAYEPETSPLLGTPPGMTYPGARRYSEETAHQIDVAVQALVESAFRRARAILADNRDRLADGAARLLEKETLTPEELPKMPRAGEETRASP